MTVATAQEFLPVELVFNPNWWYQTVGISFDQDFYLDAIPNTDRLTYISPYLVHAAILCIVALCLAGSAGLSCIHLARIYASPVQLSFPAQVTMNLC